MYELYKEYIRSSNGDQFWLQAGKLHRDDGPAVIRADGRLCWCHEGDYHRVDGPAIIFPDGTEKWIIKGRLHRDNGPAVTITGHAEYWYCFDQLHRVDGPAVTIFNPNSSNEYQFFVYGERIVDWKIYQQRTRMSDETLTMIALQYGAVE